MNITIDCMTIAPSKMLNNISWCMALLFQPPASAMSRYTTRIVRQSIATASARLVNLIPLLNCPRWKSLLEFTGASFEYRYENSNAKIENASKVANCMLKPISMMRLPKSGLAFRLDASIPPVVCKSAERVSQAVKMREYRVGLSRLYLGPRI